MKKFEGMLICTDLDGTLLRRDKTVSKENLEAIEHFKAEGGYFTFITGRMPYYVDDLPYRVKINAPFGTTNGAGLYDCEAKKYVWTMPISSGVLDLSDTLTSAYRTSEYRYASLTEYAFCARTTPPTDSVKSSTFPAFFAITPTSRSRLRRWCL